MCQSMRWRQNLQKIRIPAQSFLFGTNTHVACWFTRLSFKGHRHGNIHLKLGCLSRMRRTRSTFFIMLSGVSDTPDQMNVAVVANAGFFEQISGSADQRPERCQAAAICLLLLTPRQHQIMDMVLAGERSKNIATDLGISRRTVENHRAMIMKKTGSKSIPALARLAFMSAMNGLGQPSIETGRLLG